jgi:YVTN family beta-propeller protein
MTKRQVVQIVGLFVLFGVVASAQVTTQAIENNGPAGVPVPTQSPSPTLLVVDRGGGNENSLVFIDPTSQKIVARVPVGDGPSQVAASPDGKLAFVSNFGRNDPGHTISVIDVAGRRELQRVDLGPLLRPHGMVVAAGKVYFTAQTSKVIGRYDPATNKLDLVLGTGQELTHMMAVSRDAKNIFATNRASDTVTAFESTPPNFRFDPPDWKAIQISVGKKPEGIDISPDGTEVWVAAREEGNISIIDMTTKKVIHTFNVGTQESHALKFTPDGKRVVMTDTKAGNAVIVDVVARTVIKRIMVGDHPESVLVAPDGTHAYVAVQRDRELAIIDLKKLEVSGRIPMATGSANAITDAKGVPNVSGPSGMAWIDVR